MPWPVWLSWLDVLLQREKLLVAATFAIVAGSVLAQGTNERQPIDVSLSHGCFSPSLPLSLKINKIKIKFFLKMHVLSGETFTTWVNLSLYVSSVEALLVADKQGFLCDSGPARETYLKWAQKCIFPNNTTHFIIIALDFNVG